mmetsp:Transcript_28501/g.25231  ORF Transcript_28501/g.25231 Transcript_28501/m.25231 type:complete len:275 (+) Transcript_28501:2-826(+)
MSYDFDEESANFHDNERESERFSTMSTMVANYDLKLTNITNELKIVSQKVSQKLKNYSKFRSEILNLYSNMIELTHHLNETLTKRDNKSKDAQINTIKWKNLSIKYVKQVRTLEAAIFQKQKDLDKAANLNGKKGSKNNGLYDEEDEMTELIEPEHTGEEVEALGLKQRLKDPVHGESFEEFMRRRSNRIAKLKDSMEKINGLYNDLNELAMEQDHQIDTLDFNMDKGLEGAKKANKQLKAAKPKSMVNLRLIISVIILLLAIPLIIRWSFFKD